MVTAAHYPQHVESLILLGTSPDFKPGFAALEKTPIPKGLSAPAPDHVNFIYTLPDTTHSTLQERAEVHAQLWRKLDGNHAQFDREFYIQQGKDMWERSPIKDAYDRHAKSMKASFKLHKQAIQHINTSTLILQGQLDPVFPPDHGDALHKNIKGSTLKPMADMGHAISPRMFDQVIEKIDTFLSKGALSKN